MIGKIRWAIIAALAILAVAGAALLSDAADRRGTGLVDSGISVVVYGGDSDDRWRSLDQGIRQACLELGIEKIPIHLARSGDPGRQLELLTRELENGAKGLLVAPGPDGELPGFLTSVPSQIPVVLLGHPGGEDIGLPIVGCDPEAMADALAAQLAQKNLRVAALRNDLAAQSSACNYAAFVDAMERRGKSVTTIRYTGSESADLKAYLALSLATHRPRVDVFVALDNDSLEVASDALPASMTGASLWGIGSSDKVVHALDSGLIDAIVYQNEYATGYLGIMTLAGKMGLAAPPGDAPIQYRFVTQSNMYEKEVEQLLFPILQ